MKTKNLALGVAGTIFGLVAVMHLLRILLCVSVNIGGCCLPYWVNWAGLFGAGFLCVWMWWAAVKKQ